ncbi:hypothetical protein CHARACLAT_030623 [Characodon lateralis]|uniref:Uncharacterized protein n=1 Tax=Characodon lateralis TaxID=208331 RepID=A0ABU7DQ47_9TELE|nr:hypothetical protein [Characodon lateralis]
MWGTEQGSLDKNAAQLDLNKHTGHMDLTHTHTHTHTQPITSRVTSSHHLNDKRGKLLSVRSDWRLNNRKTPLTWKSQGCSFHLCPQRRISICYSKEFGKTFKNPSGIKGNASGNKKR